MNKKVLTIVMAAAVVLIGGTLLFSNNKNNKGNENSGSIEITHNLGTTNLDSIPEKVVVLDYGALDVLDKLEVNVVGVPQSGKLPSYLDKYSSSKYSNVGSIKEPNLEAINELKPDVIIMAGRMQDYYEQLSEIAPTVFCEIDGGKYIESFESNLKIFGKLFDKEDDVNKIVEEVSNKIKEANKIVSAKNYTASSIMLNGRNISAFTAGSRYGLLFNGLGFKQIDNNLEDSSHGQEVSYEYLVEKNPDYIFVVDRNSITGTNQESSAKDIIENELVKQTDAYKNSKIVYLNSVYWYTVSGGYTSTIGMIDEVLNSI